MNRKLLIGLAVAGASALGFGAVVAFGRAAPRTAANYVYLPPKARPDGIAVADAATLGVDTTRIRAMVRPYLDDRRGRHTSLLVMKDGRLIVEEYFNGWKPDRRHVVQSVSKSITSLLVGYGIAQRYITSVDDPIVKYLPNYRHLLGGGKERITIRHLLTMTSGLQWDESTRPYTDSLNTRVQHSRSKDGTAFTLGRPLVANPGETWSYNGGGITILTEILSNASGLTSRQFVARAFAGLLEDEEIEPTFEADGRMNSSGGIYVTPRGLIKIGQMLLQHGSWNGKAVFDSSWIRQSTEAVVNRRVGYGYAWWRQAFKLDGRWVEAIVGNGYGGQHIYAFAGLRMVVVTTATNYDHETPADTTLGADVFPALGPFHLTAGRLVSSGIVDSASAAPPRNAAWAEILRDSTAALGVYRVLLDTAASRRLADGSYLIWSLSSSAKTRLEQREPYNRVVSRFIIRCETPTDGRFKRVSTTGYLDDAFVFQDHVGVETAMAQPWSLANANSSDWTAFRRECERTRRDEQTR
jgi:CubicO group peptidase (beta-lactamase class C family)